MPTIRLNDVSVASLKTADVQCDFYCDRTPRFGVRVGKSGSKMFFVIVGTPRRRHRLGKYPEIALKQARDAAKRLLIAPPMEAGTTLTKDAFDSYSDVYLDRNYKLRSAKEAKRLIKKHMQPLMQRPLGKISKSELTTVFGRLPHSEANHLFGVLRTFFAWCESHDLVARSPVTHLSKPFKETARDRVLNDDELCRIWVTSAQLHTFGKIVRLLILTGQRKSEIAELKLTYLGKEQITWPSAVTKNGREHTLPITPTIAALANELVPIVTARPFRTWSKPKVELDKLSGVTAWTIHDLRRTFATTLARLGTSPHIIEATLNHASGKISGVAAIYNRYSYLDEAKVAVCLMESHLNKLTTQAAAKQSSSVGVNYAETGKPNSGAVKMVPDG